MFRMYFTTFYKKITVKPAAQEKLRVQHGSVKDAEKGQDLKTSTDQARRKMRCNVIFKLATLIRNRSSNSKCAFETEKD